METYLLRQWLAWDSRPITPRTIHQEFPWLYYARRYMEEQTYAYREMTRRLGAML
jgi:hypothetical protein